MCERPLERNALDDASLPWALGVVPSQKVFPPGKGQAQGRIDPSFDAELAAAVLIGVVTASRP